MFLIEYVVLSVDSLFQTLLTFPIIIAIWFTNTWYTGYFPINSNVSSGHYVKEH